MDGSVESTFNIGLFLQAQSYETFLTQKECTN